MIDRIREAFANQPVGGKVRVWVFASVSTAILAAEIVPYIVYKPGLEVADVVFAVALTLSIALMGYWPLTGGLAYIGICLLEMPIWTDVALPTLGIYILVADWVSRRWYLQALMALVIVNGFSAIRTPPSDRISLLVVTAFLGTIAVVVGLALQWNQARVVRLRHEAALSQQMIHDAGEKVRRELVTGLHDTVARDLVRLIVACQAKSDGQGAINERDVDVIRHLADDALQHLRSLMAPCGKPVPQSLGAVISTCDRMLASRGITLVGDLDPDLDSQLTAAQRELLSLIIQEGSVNILKYAQEGLPSDLLVERSAGGGITLTLASPLAGQESSGGRAFTGGFGLDNLANRVQAEGGMLYYGPRGESWVLVAELAPDPAVDLSKVVLEDSITTEVSTP